MPVEQNRQEEKESFADVKDIETLSDDGTDLESLDTSELGLAGKKANKGCCSACKLLVVLFLLAALGLTVGIYLGNGKEVQLDSVSAAQGDTNQVDGGVPLGDESPVDEDSVDLDSFDEDSQDDGDDDEDEDGTTNPWWPWGGHGGRRNRTGCHRHNHRHNHSHWGNHTHWHNHSHAHNHSWHPHHGSGGRGGRGHHGGGGGRGHHGGGGRRHHGGGGGPP